MNKAKAQLKKAWEENPLAVIGVGTAVATVAVQVINSLVSANNSRTWRKEVNRRTKKTTK